MKYNEEVDVFEEQSNDDNNNTTQTWSPVTSSMRKVHPYCQWKNSFQS
jgi:hypothetical protein